MNKDAFIHDIDSFLWRQWAQLGASVTASDTPDVWCIDVEQLLLFTLKWAGHDARLLGEVLDWLALNRDQISVRRLANLSKDDDVAATLSNAALAWAKGQSASAPNAEHSEKSIALGPALPPELQDPTFAGFGVSAPRFTRSRKSRKADTREKAIFQLRLRVWMGVGARSEVARVLATTAQPIDTAAIIKLSGFSRRNVVIALDELERGGWVRSNKVSGRNIYYPDAERWRRLAGLSLSTPDLVDWALVFDGVLAAQQWLDAPDEATPYIKQRRAFDAQVPVFRAVEGLHAKWRNDEGIEDRFAVAVQMLARHLESPPQPQHRMIEPIEERRRRLGEDTGVEIVMTLLNGIANFGAPELRKAAELGLWSVAIPYMLSLGEALTRAVIGDVNKENIKRFHHKFVDKDRGHKPIADIYDELWGLRNQMVHRFLGGAAYGIALDETIDVEWERRADVLHFNPLLVIDAFLNVFSRGSPLWDFARTMSSDELREARRRLLKEFSKPLVTASKKEDATTL